MTVVHFGKMIALAAVLALGAVASAEAALPAMAAAQGTAPKATPAKPAAAQPAKPTAKQPAKQPAKQRFTEPISKLALARSIPGRASPTAKSASPAKTPLPTVCSRSRRGRSP